MGNAKILAFTKCVAKIMPVLPLYKPSLAGSRLVQLRIVLKAYQHLIEIKIRGFKAIKKTPA